MSQSSPLCTALRQPAVSEPAVPVVDRSDQSALSTSAHSYNSSASPTPEKMPKPMPEPNPEPTPEPTLRHGAGAISLSPSRQCALTGTLATRYARLVNTPFVFSYFC